MTWQTNVPRGDLLPLNERPRFKGNWDYIQTEMRDNHYWNQSDEKDGRHRRCDMPNLESDGDITVDGNGDPDVIPNSTNGIYYVRAKTATEAPEGQFSEPFYAMNDGSRLQFVQLGIRAMVTFRVSGGSIVKNSEKNWDYQHNVSAVSMTNTGRFTITFASPMPNNRYLVLATAESNSSSDSGVRIAQVALNGKATGSVKIKVQQRTSSSFADPPSLSVVVIGS